MADLINYLLNRNRAELRSKGNLIENQIVIDHTTANGILKCLNNSVTIESGTTSRSSFEEITSYTCSGKFIALITKAMFAAQTVETYTTKARFLGNLPCDVFLRLNRLSGSNGALAPISCLTEENPTLTFDFTNAPIRLFESDEVALLGRCYPYQDSGNHAGTIQLYGSLWLYLIDKSSNSFQGERRFDFNNSIGLS